MIRSSIIALSKTLILQGAIDPMWAASDWGINFDNACQRVWQAVVDAGLDFYQYRGVTLTLTDGMYPLPEGVHSVTWVQDATGPIYDAQSNRKEYLLKKQGFRLHNSNIILTNFTTLPATITIDYEGFPKDMGIWTGDNDDGSPTGDTWHPPTIEQIKLVIVLTISTPGGYANADLVTQTLVQLNALTKPEGWVDPNGEGADWVDITAQEYADALTLAYPSEVFPSDAEVTDPVDTLARIVQPLYHEPGATVLTDEELAALIAQYTPDAPLHDNRGARLLAIVIAELAKFKDRQQDQDAWAIADSLIEGFVHSLHTRSNTGPRVVGY